MRLFIPAVFLALCVLPVAALVANHAYFPMHIEQRLNQSAQSGDLADVSSEANRLTNLYPTYQDKIASYVKNVVTPATKITASMHQGRALAPVQAINRRASQTDVAYELNNLESGAATFTK